MDKRCLLAGLVVLAACPSVGKDNDETAVPIVEFDPQHQIIPFPNNLVLDPSTGKVNLPAQACESPTAAAIRTGVLNQLDGFGTFEAPIVVTLTAPADAGTLASSVFLYKRAPVASTTPVPISVSAGTTLRFDPNDCSNPATIDDLTIIPKVPLDPNSTYTLVVLDGLQTGGAPYKASFAWGLVRQSADPVMVSDGCDPTTFAGCTILANRTPIPEPASTDPSDPNLQELVGIDFLWKAHAAALAFLDTVPGQIQPNRANVLVATDFTTQTTTSPLDPSVPGSPAANLASNPLIAPNLNPGVFSVAKADGAPCNAAQGCTAFMTAAGLPCGTGGLPCDAIGDILGAGLVTTPYQVLGPNPLAGGKMIPGPWSDPVKPAAQTAVALDVIAILPNPTVVSGGVTPPGGWPVVVFGHGLGSSKESLLAIAGQLAKAGFASVAIDFQASGSRAIATSTDAALGCAGTCYQGTTNTGTACDTLTACAAGETCINGFGLSTGPTVSNQCYAPILSTDLATTRDNIRQTILDLQRLVKAVQACGPTACPVINNSPEVFTVDSAHVEYMGISLGGIIGSTTTAVEPHFNSAVLNVAAMGLLDILENTQTLEIKCPLVNALIDLGIVQGTKWDPTNPTVGTCTTDAWKQQPGYAQFSQTARWVLDPADGANFASKLASKRFLLQEVVNDQVVPNVATDDEGMLVGLSPGTADPFTPVTTTASAAITTNPLQSLWVRYPTLPASDATTGGYGNAFQHASLLEPAAVAPGHCSNDATMACGTNSDCGGANVCIFPGVLGTLRVQLDAITYLFANK